MKNNDKYWLRYTSLLLSILGLLTLILDVRLGATILLIAFTFFVLSCAEMK